MKLASRQRANAPVLLVAVSILLAACADRSAVAPEIPAPTPTPEAPAVPVAGRALQCHADVKAGSVICAAPTPSAGGASAAVVGGQHTYVSVRSQNVSYDAGTQTFSFDVTVENLLPQDMGTTDGVTPDANGVRVFFHEGPVVTEGTGLVEVANADGTGTFLTSSRPFFRYDGILAAGDTTPAKPWRITVPATVTRFDFVLYVQAALRPLLVINEVMPDPTVVTDANGEWIEIYNRGLDAVDLNGWRLVSANDAQHTISGTVVIPARGYVVLGRSTDFATNGGVPVAYGYGATVNLNNSNTDWVALRTPAGASADSVHWGGGANVPSAASRALTSPALDNTIVMGPNWFTSATAYNGTDKGTPGGPNDGSAGPTAGPPATVTVSPATFTLSVGATRQFSAQARDSNGQLSPTTFVWTSLQPSVASVNTTGLVTGVAAGSAQIVAVAANGVADTADVTVITAPTGSVYRNHLEFGTPADGTPNNEILINHPEFSLSYSPVRGGPNWVSWNKNQTHFGGADRCDCFSADFALPDSVYRVVTSDYTGSGYSRGHMVMSEQRTRTDAENQRTFLMTNVLPQLQALNGGPWLQFEFYTNDLAQAQLKEVWNLAGGTYPASPATLNGAGKVQIPSTTWKIIVVMNYGQGLANVASASDIQVIAVNMPNTAAAQGTAWQTYRTSVDAIEAATGYDFLSALPDAIEAAVEAATS